jgi:2-methylcitrate dehydratase PrpD
MSFDESFTARVSDAPPPLAAGAEDAIAAFVSTLRYDVIEDVVRHVARRHLLKTVGLMIAGATSDVAVRTEEMLSAVRPAGTIPVVGRSRRADLLDAAFLGGLSAHDDTRDDADPGDPSHALSAIVPVALAAGFKVRAGGKAVVEAIIGGTVTATAIGRTAGRDGTVPAIGAVGAAMAGGKLYGLSARRLTHATRIAAATATGQSSSFHGRDIGRLRSGHAARDGLQAALLAGRGVEGPATAVGAQGGHLTATAFEPAGTMPAITLQSAGAGGRAGGGNPHVRNDHDLDATFFDRAAPTFGASAARALIAQLWAIDTLDDIAPLLEALTAPWD